MGHNNHVRYVKTTLVDIRQRVMADRTHIRLQVNRSLPDRDSRWAPNLHWKNVKGPQEFPGVMNWQYCRHEPSIFPEFLDCLNARRYLADLDLVWVTHRKIGKTCTNKKSWFQSPTCWHHFTVFIISVFSASLFSNPRSSMEFKCCQRA
jgi:hypothetical protein